VTEQELDEITKRGHVRVKGDAVFAPLMARTHPGVKGIIRQSGQGPNKTEIRFENDYLKPMRHAGEIGEYKFEAITLKLAPGLRYTPDYSTVTAAGVTVFYEIKGAILKDDAIVKFKMAPSIFPHYEFYLCQWKGGEWTIQKGLK
jgi:hypothetical protein